MMPAHEPTPPSAPLARPPRPALAVASLVLSLIFPVGLLLFVLRTTYPTLESLRIPGIGLLLHGVTDGILVLGVVAFCFAIVLGHLALAQARSGPSTLGARRIARTGLALGYLSLLTVLGGMGFMTFWLSTHRMHLVW